MFPGCGNSQLEILVHSEARIKVKHNKKLKGKAQTCTFPETCKAFHKCCLCSTDIACSHRLHTRQQCLEKGIQ